MAHAINTVKLKQALERDEVIDLTLDSDEDEEDTTVVLNAPLVPAATGEF